jgi:hypothetical protein
MKIVDDRLFSLTEQPSTAGKAKISWPKVTEHESALSGPDWF